MDEYDCLYPLTGLLYNVATGSCEWAAKATCFTEDGIEAVEAEFEPEFDCEEEGNFPDPEYCMRYFRCDAGLEVGCVVLVIMIIICKSNIGRFMESIVPLGLSMRSTAGDVSGHLLWTVTTGVSWITSTINIKIHCIDLDIKLVYTISLYIYILTFRLVRFDLETILFNVFPCSL